MKYYDESYDLSSSVTLKALDLLQALSMCATKKHNAYRWLVWPRSQQRNEKQWLKPPLRHMQSRGFSSDGYVLRPATYFVAQATFSQPIVFHTPLVRRRREQSKVTLIIQAMVVFSKMAQSCNASEQNLYRALAAILRNRKGVRATLAVDTLQQPTFAEHWQRDAPRSEDLDMTHGEFKNKLEAELGANLTENQTDSLGWLIALFAIGSGYLPPPLRKPDDGFMRDLAWSAIWSLHQDAGKERVRKLLNKYMHTEPTFDNINALIKDVNDAIGENMLRPQTCGNDGCSHLGKSYACQTCKAVFYCSEKCQGIDWPRHKSECTQRRDYAALKKGLTETATYRKRKTRRRATLARSSTKRDLEITLERYAEADTQIVPETVGEPLIPDQSMTTRRGRIGRCCNDACHKDASKMCGGCETTYYCSKACQKADWPNHRAMCLAARHHEIDDKPHMIKVHKRTTS